MIKLRRINKIALTGLAAIAIYALSSRSCENKEIPIYQEKVRTEKTAPKIDKKDSLDNIINYETHKDSTIKYQIPTQKADKKYDTPKQEEQYAAVVKEISASIKDSVSYKPKTKSLKKSNHISDEGKMIMGDVNNDERMDLLVLEETKNKTDSSSVELIEILENTGAEYTKEIIIAEIKKKPSHQYDIAEAYVNNDKKIDVLVLDTDMNKGKTKIEYFKNKSVGEDVKFKNKWLRSKILTFQYNHGNKKVKNYFGK